MPESAQPRLPAIGFGAGAGAAAVVVLLLVLLLGGGAPQEVAAGLPTAGPVLDWALAVLPLATNALAVGTVGVALLAGGYLRAEGGSSEAVAATRLLAAGWAALGLLLAVGAAARVAALTGSAGLAEISASVQVRSGIATVALAGAVALVVRSRPRLALPLALAALLPEVLTGHVRTAEGVALTAAVLLTHVAAASLWVGGLLALGWTALRRAGEWQQLLPRFSRLAGGCVAVLAVSGTVVALGTGGPLGALLGSRYGVVVLLKAALLLVLAGIGFVQRRYLMSHARGARTFLLLVGGELVLMAIVLALATGLSQTPTP